MSWLQGAAVVPLALAARLRRIERATVARLTDAAATTAATGIPLDDGRLMRQFVHRRLERAGVLLAAGNDRYYFSQAAYDAFRARRRNRAMLILGLIGIGLVVLYSRGELP